MKNALALTLPVVVAAGIAVPALAGADGGASAAATERYGLSSSMTAKQMTSPRPTGGASNARGTLSGRATLGKSSTASWTLRYSGMTGQVRVAEIRYRSRGQTQVIRLCAPCKKGSKVRDALPVARCGEGVRDARACRQGGRHSEDEEESPRRSARRAEGQARLAEKNWAPGEARRGPLRPLPGLWRA